MATQTGSIDLRAQKKAHDEAEKVAKNYVLDITDGVRIHPENDTDNSVDITDGIHIRRNAEDVAYYGDTVRVGKETDGNTRIIIDPNKDENGITDAFKIIAGNEDTVGQEVVSVVLDENNVADGVTVTQSLVPPLSIENHGTITTTESTKTATREVGQMSVASGQEFSVSVSYHYTYYVGGQIMGGASGGYSFSFIRDGSSQYDEVTNYDSATKVSHNIRVDYDGDDTFTITSKAKVTETASYVCNITRVSMDSLRYETDDELLPIQNYHGDIYLNSQSVGGTYVGLNAAINSGTGRATDGDDKDLYNAIKDCGWTASVLNGLIADIKTLFAQILSAVYAFTNGTDVSSKITVSSAWTVSQKKAVKRGNRVFFWIEAYTNSYTYPYVYNFATFANDIAPKYMNAFTGHTTDGSFTPKGLLTFYTDGTTLKVSAQNNSGMYFFVNGSYEI